MSNTTTIISNPILFNKQIPVSQIDVYNFKEAINDKSVKCLINGARVNSPFSKSVSVDVSFKILDNLQVFNPGTSITGKTLKYEDAKPLEDRVNVKGKNITINFNVTKNEERGVFEVNNTHELYSILSKVLKDKDIMDSDEDGSMRIYYTKFNKLIKNGVVHLTSKEVLNTRRYSTLEVTAIPGDNQ